MLDTVALSIGVNLKDVNTIIYIMEPPRAWKITPGEWWGGRRYHVIAIQHTHGDCYEEASAQYYSLPREMAARSL